MRFAGETTAALTLCGFEDSAVTDPSVLQGAGESGNERQQEKLDP
jgi:hypothetical protein